jgi:hypothetical protein
MAGKRPSLPADEPLLAPGDLVALRAEQRRIRLDAAVCQRLKELD